MGVLLPPLMVTAQITRGPQQVSPSPSPSSPPTGQVNVPVSLPSRSVLAIESNLCPSCEGGTFQIALAQVKLQVAALLAVSPGSKASDIRIPVDITLDDGRSVGTIWIPGNLIGTDPDNDIVLQANTVTVGRTDQRVNGGQRLSSVVTDITLQSTTLGRIRQLDEPLKICLEPENSDLVCFHSLALSAS